MDLRQRLFGSRVVSRTDVGDLGQNVKSLKRIFPCGGTMAAVVDDREDVWSNSMDDTISRRGEPPENLLLIRPYHWKPFVGYADVNNAAGVDLTGDSASDANSDTDMQLVWIRDVLKRLHEQYYAETNEPPNRTTVPQLLQSIRSDVLKGTKLVLSGLVPLHRQGRDHTATPRPSVVRYAESLGCELQSSVQSDTTHLVAAKDGTDKALMARKIVGCHVVKVSWMMECYWSLTRRDEKPHLFASHEKTSRDASVTDRTATLQESTNTTSGSEGEDDDLVASFEREFL